MSPLQWAMRMYRATHYSFSHRVLTVEGFGQCMVPTRLRGYVSQTWISNCDNQFLYLYLQEDTSVILRAYTSTSLPGFSRSFSGCVYIGVVGILNNCMHTTMPWHEVRNSKYGLFSQLQSQPARDLDPNQEGTRFTVRYYQGSYQRFCNFGGWILTFHCFSHRATSTNSGCPVQQAAW